MQIDQMGYSSDSIMQTLSRINQILLLTKQKAAMQETKLLCLFLAWFCICIAGAFLTSFYLHFWWAFLFAGLLVAGFVVFYRWFGQSEKEQLMLKAHLALCVALRTENNLVGSIDGKNFK
jgi:hypothetical protein